VTAPHRRRVQERRRRAAKYDTTWLVVKGEVVVVNMTYRLGVLGYLTPNWRRS
jgi:carboxylesterase type B